MAEAMEMHLVQDLIVVVNFILIIVFLYHD